jgi:hypothetical protein
MSGITDRHEWSVDFHSSDSSFFPRTFYLLPGKKFPYAVEDIRSNNNLLVGQSGLFFIMYMCAYANSIRIQHDILDKELEKSVISFVLRIGVL